MFGFLKRFAVDRIKKRLFNMLKEPSTYKGLVVVLGVLGVSLAPEKIDAICTACAAVFGALSILLPDVFGTQEAQPVPLTVPEIAARVEPGQVKYVPEPTTPPPASPGTTKWDGKVPGQFP